MKTILTLLAVVLTTAPAFAQTGYWANQTTAYERARDAANRNYRPSAQPQQGQSQQAPDRTNMVPVTINGEVHWFPKPESQQPQQRQTQLSDKHGAGHD